MCRESEARGTENLQQSVSLHTATSLTTLARHLLDITHTPTIATDTITSYRRDFPFVLRCPDILLTIHRSLYISCLRYKCRIFNVGY